MSIRIKLFGEIVDIIGKNAIQVERLNDTNSLRKKIVVDFPKLKNCSFIMIVNKKIANENQILNSNDEIAFLPPFSGG